MVSVAYGQGQIQRGRMRGKLYVFPPAIFKSLFDVYNFSIISNLFDRDKLYALTTHNPKCANKMYHRLFGEVLIIRVKTFKQSLPEN